MCGLTGYIGGEWPNGFEGAENQLKLMSEAIKHRGPNFSGTWIDQDHGIAFAHRRLSILDLSDNGNQPMFSSSKRFVILFNGEIYNHLSLRAELEKNNSVPDWNGHSDTETILAYIENYGFSKTLKNCVGMFAIALLDRKEKVLYLARDRIGEKPLYYGWQKNAFLFGSELKALKAHSDFIGEISRKALSLYLRHNYIPAPHSIYKGIKKLIPGTYLKLRINENLKNIGDLPEPIKFWSMNEIVKEGTSNSFDGNESDAIDSLDSLLMDSVKHQMISDVPLGAFLSGGIDSSLIVALMQRISNRPVKTFTIGFNDKNYNEANYAKSIADYLGTEHTELYVSPQDSINIIPSLSHIYDEPFADSSQIPTFLVSELARQDVTVSLSGDAGDELFGGYDRYIWVKNIWNNIQYLPKPFLSLFIKGILSFSPERLDKIGSTLFTGNKKIMRFGDKAFKLANVLKANSPEEIYINLMSLWKNPSSIVIGNDEPLTVLTELTEWPAFNDFEHQMMYIDTMSYLPDDLLVKVDRAAMSVSLETRIPFLDHRVIEFAWSFPLDMKIRNGQSKWLLKQVLSKYVPKTLIDRPKMGFGVPIDSWLRGPLKEWADTLLNETRLNQEGFFNPAPIRKKWDEHLSRKRNWHYQIWAILMYQQWLENEKKN
tara:strand:- start:9772 stop:11742 length:1971 start_codon:yes stop_codon:yes gene_type:complete